MTKVGHGPMLAKLESEIPRGPGWTYEPKWDGFRTIVTVGDEIRLDSRTDRPMVRFFPELVSLLEERRDGPFVADGEIVMVRPGRLAFDELQLRLHPAESRVRKLAAEIPASLILFDLLEENGDKLGAKPLAERRDRLAALSERLHVSQAAERLEDLDLGPDLLLTPWTDDIGVAERWFADEAGLGQDGIVAKRDDQPYLPGARGWVKVKHRKTADCVVGGYRVAKGGEGVGSLLLGLYDDEGKLHYVGHTSSFRAKERREIQELLRPLEEGAESFAGWARARRTEPVVGGEGHRVGHRAAGSRLRGGVRPDPVRQVPACGDVPAVASRSRAEDLYLGSAGGVAALLGGRGLIPSAS